MMQLRMTQEIHQKIRSDLRRFHPFAYERVGYTFIRPLGNDVLVVTGYESVPDEFYIKDKTVGARIDHRGIVLAMKRADKNKEGILHTHVHGGFGFPQFSLDDEVDHCNFVRSFKNSNPQMPHGFLLLSKDKMRARIWMPGHKDYSDLYKYSIIGLPPYYGWTRGLYNECNK